MLSLFLHDFHAQIKPGKLVSKKGTWLKSPLVCRCYLGQTVELTVKPGQ